MKRADRSEIKYLDFVRIRQSCDVALFCIAFLLTCTFITYLNCIIPCSTFLLAFKNKNFLDPTTDITVDNDECLMGMAYLFLPRGFGDLRLTPVYTGHDVSRLQDNTCPMRLLVLLQRNLCKYTKIVQQLVSGNPDIVVAGLATEAPTSYSKLFRYAFIKVAALYLSSK